MVSTVQTNKNNRKVRVSGARFLAVAAVILFGFAGGLPGWAQSGSQSASTASPVLEYEVATIKTYKPGSAEAGGAMRVGIFTAPDGFTASGATAQMLIQFAYGVQNYQISGGPDWVNSERLDVDAKMDSATADALQKMSQDDRNLARQKMLQALLADRFKLTVQRETKDLPIYTLVVGKNGPKLQEAKPSDAPAATPPAGRGGRGGPGSMMMGFDSGSMSLTGTAVPLTALVRTLSASVRRPIVDKTGLIGKYDITLKWSPDESASPGPGFAGLPSGGPPSGGAPTGIAAGGAAPDPSGPTLFVAIQEQLGLKLESGKGPVEMIVISHIEKASDN